MLLCLKEPLQPSCPDTGKFEKKLLFVAQMGNVPDLPWDMMTIGSAHIRLFLKPAIWAIKMTF